MKHLIVILLCIISFSTASANSGSKQDSLAIETVIANYTQSINTADTIFAKTFWLVSDDISFIHPKGHEKGWEGVKKGIYEMFGSRFSKRDLKSYNHSIRIYDDMAVVVFYWIYDATFSGDNPDVMQSKGRETQVLIKDNGYWKIVHVHYSGMPKTGEREGF